jgi:hypothetical protein
MLRGDKEALGSTALSKNRAKQKAELEATLKARLGSGYATSSAGIQALREFESQSADLQESNRLNVINSFLPTLSNISATGIQPNISNAATLGGLSGNLQNRQVGAITGTGQNLIDSAGADAVRQYQAGGALSGATTTLGGFGKKTV